MSTSAVNYALIPIKKAFWALHFGNCLAKLKTLYITHVTNHRFRFFTEWVVGEVLVGEDDSRSSSRVREHGSFLLVSQLYVAIQTL